MTRSHGAVRGLNHVNKSSLKDARFGRMFRWLPGETYQKADLLELAKTLIQRETADFRDLVKPPIPRTEFFEEGPDVVFQRVPFKRPPDTNELLDTAYGESEPADENPTIPAGYTYFGQFIDHDLTFDPNSSLQKQNDPDATEDFRTPRLDLDSMYGRGPDGRGRSRGYLLPPAQIPACGFPAPGSCRRSDASGIRGLGGLSSSGPWAQAVGDMPVPALCPGHALALTLPSTGRLPSTLSVISPSTDVVRGFIGTMQPSDSSDLPVRLRLFAFPNRPGTALAAAGGRRSPRFRHDP